MEALQDGDVPTVLDNLTRPVLKSIVNIIGNVLNNSEFHISQAQKRILKPYISTYTLLLDKRQSLEDKKYILQQKGAAFLPTFLDIVGDDISLFMPEKVNRSRRTCPVCGREDLLKLSNHLRQVHNITGDERRRMLKTSTAEQKNGHGRNSSDDQGNKDSDKGDT